MSVGQVLAEKYRLVEQLSRGGMGSVWRAEHIELGTPAAVKLIDPALAETEEALVRFRREAQSAASLRSSNIVQIFDYGVAQGIPYIAMELLRGQSLARRLALHGSMSPVETAVVLSQVAKAVSWAHSMGVVHRDLKPDNVFLAEDAGETVVKLLDFGIAKTFDMAQVLDAPTTITGAMMGTPFYMSPEQASGKRSVDYRSDIWAFAVIAFECLTGRRPFHADTLGGLVLVICSEPLPRPSTLANVPLGFDEWFARAANRHAELRYPSIREAASELRRICAMGLDEEALGPLSASGIHSGPEPSPADGFSSSTLTLSEPSSELSTMAGSALESPKATKRGLRLGLTLGLGLAAAVVIVVALRGQTTPSRVSPGTNGENRATMASPNGFNAPVPQVPDPATKSLVGAKPAMAQPEVSPLNPVEPGQAAQPKPQAAPSGPRARVTTSARVAVRPSALPSSSAKKAGLLPANGLNPKSVEGVAAPAVVPAPPSPKETRPDKDLDALVGF